MNLELSDVLYTSAQKDVQIHNLRAQLEAFQKHAKELQEQNENMSAELEELREDSKEPEPKKPDALPNQVPQPAAA